MGDWVALEDGRRPGSVGDPRRAPAAHRVRPPRRRRPLGPAGAGRQRGHRVPRHGPRPGLQSPPHRAGPGPGLGERGRPGGAPEQGRPVRGRGRAAGGDRGRGAGGAGAGDRGEARGGSRGARAVARARSHGGASRLVGGRQVDPREPAPGRGAAEDPGGPGERPARASHHDPSGAGDAARRRAPGRHPGAAGAPALGQRGGPGLGLRRRRGPGARRAASATAPTTRSRAARCRRRWRRASSRRRVSPAIASCGQSCAPWRSGTIPSSSGRRGPGGGPSTSR